MANQAATAQLSDLRPGSGVTSRVWRGLVMALTCLAAAAHGGHAVGAPTAVVAGVPNARSVGIVQFALMANSQNTNAIKMWDEAV